MGPTETRAPSLPSHPRGYFEQVRRQFLARLRTGHLFHADEVHLQASSAPPPDHVGSLPTGSTKAQGRHRRRRQGINQPPIFPGLGLRSSRGDVENVLLPTARARIQPGHVTVSTIPAIPSAAAIGPVTANRRSSWTREGLVENSATLGTVSIERAARRPGPGGHPHSGGVHGRRPHSWAVEFVGRTRKKNARFFNPRPMPIASSRRRRSRLGAWLTRDRPSSRSMASRPPLCITKAEIERGRRALWARPRGSHGRGYARAWRSSRGTRFLRRVI